MPRFNVDKARAAGMSEQDISAYLSSPQAQADSSAQAPSGGNNVVAGVLGMGAEALNAIPRPLLYGTGALGVGGAAFRMLRGAPAVSTAVPPPQEAPAPVPVQTDHRLVELTPEDIAQHPEFSQFRPGQTVSRERWEAVKFGDTGSARARVTRGQGKVVGSIKPGEPPSPTTKGSAGSRTRGASTPELARRQAPMSRTPAIQEAVQGGTPGGMSLEEQLSQSLAAEQAMTAKGIPVGAERVPIRAGLRGAAGTFGPPALEALLMLLNASHSQEQMDQAQQIFGEVNHPQPSTRRALAGSPSL